MGAEALSASVGKFWTKTPILGMVCGGGVCCDLIFSAHELYEISPQIIFFIKYYLYKKFLGRSKILFLQIKSRNKKIL